MYCPNIALIGIPERQDCLTGVVCDHGNTLTTHYINVFITPQFYAGHRHYHEWGMYTAPEEQIQ